MMLTLTRPLCVIDTETTGVETDLDRIVEIAALRVEVDGTETVFEGIVNPGCPIPPEATEVHGLTDERVDRCPKFGEVWPKVAALLAGADVCAYNARFDLAIIAAECKRAGIDWTPPPRVIDPLVIFRESVPHTLTGAVDYYLCEEHEDAHGAMGDCRATLRVLGVQAKPYAGNAELLAISQPRTDARWVDADRKFYWRFRAPHFSFGKHKGRPLLEVARVDRGYIEWMLRQDYGAEVDQLVRGALKGEVPRRESTVQA